MDRDMGATALASSTGAGSRAGAGTATAEAGPSAGPDELQRLVDQSATFQLLIIPDARRAGTPLRIGTQITGIRATESVRRLTLTLDAPSPAGVIGTNVVAEQVGEVYFEWLFIPREALAHPGGTVTPVAIDRTVSQRFVMQEATFRFAGGEAFRAFGTGRSFPMTDGNGRPVLAVGAVCNIAEGTGRFRNRVGNFTLAGELRPDGLFAGEVMVRVLDPDGSIRAGTVKETEATSDHEEGITYLTWIAQKTAASDQDNYFSIGPDGQPRGLDIPVALKRVWTDFSVGPFCVSTFRTGEIIGREIGFGRESRPRTAQMGTATTPYQFEGVSRYSFYDQTGATVGTLTANVLEGRSIAVQFPAAPDAPGLRFGYFGPIVNGSGCFRGVNGMLYGTAGSVLVPPPAKHVISNLYVARLHDLNGRWRRADPCSTREACAAPAARPAAPVVRRPNPTFLPLVDRLDVYADQHKRWRESMKSCAARFARVISSHYNRHRYMGEFTAWDLDESHLREALEGGGVKPFDEATFNRYGGRAKGVFRTYTFDEHDEIGSAALYSYWDTTNFKREDGRIFKQITGSNTRYYQPDQLPDLAEGKVDILANSWREDVGVVSYVDIHQGERHLRTSFAYKLPRPYEILWFVRDLWINGREIRDNAFMTSHEWKEVLGGRMCYLMVAMFYELDFERRDIRLQGDTFWRVRYEEE